MSQLQEIKTEMFSHGDKMIEMAEIFGALASDCRLEIIYLLLRIESLPSGEIARLTNCTPSQVSQNLAKMHATGLVKKKRTWREIEYSLDQTDPFVQAIVNLLQIHLK